MSQLVIILWIILYPLATTLEKYVALKIGEMIKREYNENVGLIMAILHMVVFIVVLLKLLNS